MALNLKKLTNDFLESNPEIKFTARQIAEYIFKEFPEECEEKRQNSTAKVIVLDTDAALISQLIAEIGSHRPRLQKDNKNIKVTDTRPRYYYFTTKTDNAEVLQAESSAKKTDNEESKIKESELYPILSSFLYSELQLYSKRIDEKKSSNTQGNKGNHWLFPDVVAMENLSNDWHDEIKSAAKLSSDRLAKLWSFEVKILINRSNVRECFFQAVSNSSWANFGYLVAKDIGDGTLKELRILSGLHGIGFIKLDVENPSESSIIIPARENIDIDWNTANRLAGENKDFVHFIKSLRQFYQTGDIKESDWEKQEY